MSTTYTTRLNLGKPAAGDRSWNTVWDANADALESSNVLGALAVRLAEVPSASLNVKVAPGSYRKRDGTVGTYAGATQAIGASLTRVLYLDAAGALQVAAAYPAAAHVRLATVVTGGSTVSSITDDRLACSVLNNAGGGTFVQTYSTADRTLNAYTPDVESSAYTGLATGVGGTPYAALTDLNALRVAYENLRALVEDLAQFVNGLVDDLQSEGLVS